MSGGRIVLATVTVLAFCAAEVNPVSAQVMKNFSWKKKARPKAQDAASVKPPETGQARSAPRRHKAKSGN